MTKRFKIGRYELTISMGTSYWGGGEPIPVRAGWGFEIDLDFNNRHKLQVNHDFTKILTDEMRGHWCAIAKPLNDSVVDHDIDLMALSNRIKESGAEVMYMRHPNYDYLHTH